MVYLMTLSVAHTVYHQGTDERSNIMKTGETLQYKHSVNIKYIKHTKKNIYTYTFFRSNGLVI
jgi:hypothetical protein